MKKLLFCALMFFFLAGGVACSSPEYDLNREDGRSLIIDNVVQTIYSPGEALCPEGRLTLVLQDGTKEAMEITADMLVEQSAPLQAGEFAYIVEYDGLRAEMQLSVNDSGVKGETLKVLPDKTICFWGDSFDFTGGRLERQYEDGEKTDTLIPSGYANKTVASVKVSEQDRTEERVVLTGANGVTVGEIVYTVRNPAVALEIIQPVAKTAYRYLDDIDVSGATVCATRLSGDKDPIVEMTRDMLDCYKATRPVSGEHGVEISEQLITVFYCKDTYRYEEACATFVITVEDPWQFVMVSAPEDLMPGAGVKMNAALNYTGMVLKIGHASGVVDEASPEFSVGDGVLTPIALAAPNQAGALVLKFRLSGTVDAVYSDVFTAEGGVEVVVPVKWNPIGNTPQSYRYAVTVS